MKTIRVDTKLDDADIAAFLAYYQLVYGEKPRDLNAAIRQSLRDAIDGKVNDWHNAEGDNDDED